MQRITNSIHQKQQQFLLLLQKRHGGSTVFNVKTATTAMVTTTIVASITGSVIMIRNISHTASDSMTRDNSQQHVPQSRLQLPTRSEQLQKLRSLYGQKPDVSTAPTLDVLIIGGGATGCGVALDASMRGLSTALIERYDFSTETSSRSTKLIWAGIRYLGTAIAGLFQWKNIFRPMSAIQDFVGEFRLVQIASKERQILLQNNPHLTNWVPIAIPIRNWLIWPPPLNHPLFSLAPITLPIVMKFYDSLCNFTCPPSHIMSIARSQRKFPQLDTNAENNIKYFQIFYEGQHNDARTNLCIALTAIEEGATVLNYIEMIDVLKDPITGKAIGITCRDNLLSSINGTSTNGSIGNTFNIYAKSIIFCGGPFTDELRQMEYTNCKNITKNNDSTKEKIQDFSNVTGKGEFPPAVAAAAGTHIVLPGYYSPGGIGMLDINTSDGRFLFFLPWEGSTLVGTTDRKGQVTSHHGPPENEIEWLLKEVQTYLSDDIKVRREDVLSAWQGYRPLASDPNALPGAPISRDHIISTNPNTGITFVAGGKWTTYREMAEDVLDKVIDLNQLKPIRECQTKQRILRGGIGYHRNVPIHLVQDLGVSESSAKHLARAYGMYSYDVCAIEKEMHNLHSNTSKKTFWSSHQNQVALQKSPHFGKTLVEGYPYLECEVTYACRYEMACTVADMVTLRTRLAYLNKDAALIAAPVIADIMAKELHWSNEERDRQLRKAIDLVNTFGGRTTCAPEQQQSFIDGRTESHSFEMSQEKLGQGSASRGAGFG